jgi:hypothetical protein
LSHIAFGRMDGYHKCRQRRTGSPSLKGWSRQVGRQSWLPPIGILRRCSGRPNRRFPLPHSRFDHLQVPLRRERVCQPQSGPHRSCSRTATAGQPGMRARASVETCPWCPCRVLRDHEIARNIRKARAASPTVPQIRWGRELVTHAADVRFGPLGQE